MRDSFWVQEIGTLVTGSFDKSIKFWNLGVKSPIVDTVNDFKVHAMDVQYPYMLVGTSDERIILQDLRKLDFKKNIY